MEQNVLLISVRTELIRLMSFDLTLALSEALLPKAASFCWVEPQPTVCVLECALLCNDGFVLFSVGTCVGLRLGVAVRDCSVAVYRLGV